MGFVLLAIVILVLLAGIVMLSAMRRRDTGRAIGELSRETVKRDRAVESSTPGAQPTAREVERSAVLERQGVLARSGGELVPVSAPPPAPFVAPDPETLGATRRQFMNRSMIVLMLGALGAFGGSILAFLWPPLSVGGFGGRINVGRVSDIVAEIRQGGGFLYRPEGRMWVTEYPIGALDKARAVYSGPEIAGMEAGLVALYQKCPHLGCRVPECKTSQWFECPCHGTAYNRVGEKRAGPAPRGMDRFAMSVDGGNFIVDTGMIIQGPAIGTNTTGQEAEGPNCISAATAH